MAPENDTPIHERANRLMRFASTIFFFSSPTILSTAPPARTQNNKKNSVKSV